jgi:hypothetical protein
MHRLVCSLAASVLAGVVCCAVAGCSDGDRKPIIKTDRVDPPSRGPVSKGFNSPAIAPKDKPKKAK